MQTNETMQLDDETFFSTCLDLGFPGLGDVARSVGLRDYSSAAQHFGRFIRSFLSPERFGLIPFEPAENNYKLPLETDGQAAQRIASNVLVSCGIPLDFGPTVDWYGNPTENGYLEWPWQLNRHNDWKLLASVAAREGDPDEVYAGACARQFLSWRRQVHCPVAAPGNTTLGWRTIECGIRMGANWPYVLHTFYQTRAFTDEVLAQWFMAVWEHGNRLRRHHFTGNWLVMEMNGLAQIGILFPFFRESLGWRDYAIAALTAELQRQVYPDGVQYELSTGYHNTVIMNFLRLVRTSRAYGVSLPDEYLRTLGPMVMANLWLMMPDRHLPNINDGDWTSVPDLLKDEVEIDPENPVFRWLVSRGHEGHEPDQTSVALAYAGLAVFRSGWKASDVWALLDAGPFGKDHQHEDKLSLLVFGDTGLFLTEGGNYAYDNSPMRRYVLSTRSHNTVRLDGLDQNRRKNYAWRDEDIRKPAGLRWAPSEAVDYAEGVYDEGYGPGPDVQGRHTRSVYFVKKPPFGWKPFFVVVDRVEGEDARRVEVLWHLMGQRAVVDGLRVESPRGSLCFSTGGGLEVVLGVEDPEWQGFRARSLVQGDFEATATVRQSLAGPNVRTVTVVYPYAGPSPFERIDTSAEPGESRLMLTGADGNRFSFDEAEYRGAAHR